MLRLRIRPASGDASSTFRVQVPRSGTLQDVQEAVAAVTGSSMEPAQLSLNKRTVLTDDVSTCLSSLGICSGDCLWLLNSGSSPFPSVSTAAAASEPSSKRACTSPASSTDTPAQTQPATTPAPATPPQHSATDHRGLSACSPSHAQATPAHHLPDQAAASPPAVHQPTPAWHSQQQEVPAEVPAGQATQGPSHLSRLLACLCPSSQPTTSAAAPQQAAGSTALQPHKLLLAAVLAALEEAGFTATDGPAPAEALTGAMPATCTFTHLLGAGQQPPLIAADTHSKPNSQQSQQGHNQQGPVWGQLHVRAFPMGQFLCVHMSCCAPARPMDVAADSAAAARPVTRMLHLDTQQHIHLLAVPAPTAAPHTLLTPDVYKDLKGLWVQLKDDLGAWGLANCAALAGVTPPQGLLQLPMELKLTVLQQLGARELAALCCVCCELRHLAAENMLWEPLFLRAFPGVRSGAGQIGYKAAYAHEHKRRKDLARALAASRMHMMVAPPMPHLPHNPFMPSLPGHGHPGIVGGDYDRFPALPQALPGPRVALGPLGTRPGGGGLPGMGGPLPGGPLSLLGAGRGRGGWASSWMA